MEALSKMAPHVSAVVVDNASSDNTVDLVRDLVRAGGGAKLIANDQNRGFAAAVNQGVHEAAGDFILLLNPDTELLTPIDPLGEASGRHGLAAGRLLDAEGNTQAGFTIRRFPTPLSLAFELLGVNRLWPSNRWNRAYRYLDRDLDRPGPVEQPAGAFLMFRQDVWQKLGGFDEQFYPVWFEDVDFCRRAVDAGYRIAYVPSVAARHGGGHSVNRISSRQRASYWCVSLLTYAAKHFGPWAFRGICAAVVLSSVPRMVAGMISERTLSSLVTYCNIMRFAGLCLVSAGHVKKSAVTFT
ncbi:MAG: glycosyltransferase [Acidobacteriota bacterium]|nr:glycosyltransferase [Acidobacteriota bacterium]